MAGEARLTSYLITFTIAYVVLTIGLAVVQLYLPFEASMSIPILIGAGIFAAHRFVVAHKRPFTSSEKHKMALGSLLISVASSIILLVAVALSPLGDGIGSLLGSVLEEIKDTWHVFLVILAGMLFLHWLALFLTYGWFTRRVLHR